MFYLVVGLAVLVVTVIAFVYCMPRGGKTHRFVGTELEPYVGVAFCSAIALAFTMILSGTLSMVNAQ
jgi:hypothetical protein